MKSSAPNYKLLFQDIINDEFPYKLHMCQSILSKKKISSLDIISLNTILFGKQEDMEIDNFNHKHRCYDPEAIREILNYQNKYNLNNSQLAIHFKLSRNTVTKWRKRNT
ncbi:helix-turn-helix domain-containing protein [Chryseobacterium gambrini]|uniref:Helix-turn-helix domain-containing protein n=1 Tax=Chryseobacterium gambrini TaxID=373672 RepID=A0ABN7CBY8_9FLAO|nr:helix-turn-helix domain-containing protein [Chryseobacterium gambrini]BEV03768.1 helix-turn-helix domain-containing protein [Chryseobacterium gambrini]